MEEQEMSKSFAYSAAKAAFLPSEERPVNATIATESMSDDLFPEQSEEAPKSDSEEVDVESFSTSTPKSRELRALIESAKESKIINESNLITSKIRKSRKDKDSGDASSQDGGTPTRRDSIRSNSSDSNKRSMRSQNPEFVVKQKKFLSSVSASKKRRGMESDSDSESSDSEVALLTRRKGKFKEMWNPRSSPPFYPEHLVGGRLSDLFCWRCHREAAPLAPLGPEKSSPPKGPPARCSLCPRTYHTRCLQYQKAKQPLPADSWVCPECAAIVHYENIDNRSPVMKNVSLTKLCELLKFAIKRMMDVNGIEPFLQPVNVLSHPEYGKYIVNPMDLNMLKSNITAGKYGSTTAFTAATKWILHNSIVFNSQQAKLTTVAKSLLTTCKKEMTEIENCPNCYQGANVNRKSWFTEVCEKPHILLWAKLKGFPYWPAKGMRYNQTGQVDVRFFGAHDRAWVPWKDCYLYSIRDPNNNTKVRKKEIRDAVMEIEQHIQNIIRKFGSFNHASFKIGLEPTKELDQIKLMIPNFNANDMKESVRVYTGLSTKPYQQATSKKVPVNSDNSIMDGYGTEDDEPMDESLNIATRIPTIMDEFREAALSFLSRSKANGERSSVMNPVESPEKDESKRDMKKRRHSTVDFGFGKMLKLSNAEPESENNNTKESTDTSKSSTSSSIKKLESVIKNVNNSDDKKIDDFRRTFSRSKSMEMTNVNAVTEMTDTVEVPVVSKVTVDSIPSELVISNVVSIVSVFKATKSKEDRPNNFQEAVARLQQLKNESAVAPLPSNRANAVKPHRKSVTSVRSSMEGRTITAKSPTVTNVNGASPKPENDQTKQEAVSEESEDIASTEERPVIRTISPVNRPKTPIKRPKTPISRAKSPIDRPQIPQSSIDKSEYLVRPEINRPLSPITKPTSLINLPTPIARPKTPIGIPKLPSDKPATGVSSLKSSLPQASPMVYLKVSNFAKTGVSPPREVPPASKEPSKVVEVLSEQMSKEKKHLLGSLRLLPSSSIISTESPSTFQLTRINRSVTKKIRMSDPTDNIGRIIESVATNTAITAASTNTTTTNAAPLNDISDKSAPKPVHRAKKSFPQPNKQQTLLKKYTGPAGEGKSTVAKKIVALQNGPLNAGASPSAAEKQQKTSPLRTEAGDAPSPVSAAVPLPGASGGWLSGGATSAANGPASAQAGRSPRTVPQTTLVVTAADSASVSQIQNSKPLNAVDPNVFVSNPGSVGPIHKMLHNTANKLGDTFRRLLMESLLDVSSAGHPEGVIRLLQFELENCKLQHQKELADMKYNFDLVIKEMEQSFESDLQRQLDKLRHECELEKISAVSETKNFQWCTYCGSKSQFYCCWNTSYCSYNCQLAHWPHHTSHCGQLADNNITITAPGKSIPQLTKMVLLSNTGQTIRPSAVSSALKVNVTGGTATLVQNGTGTATLSSKSPALGGAILTPVNGPSLSSPRLTKYMISKTTGSVIPMQSKMTVSTIPMQPKTTGAAIPSTSFLPPLEPLRLSAASPGFLVMSTSAASSGKQSLINTTTNI